MFGGCEVSSERSGWVLKTRASLGGSYAELIGQVLESGNIQMLKSRTNQPSQKKKKRLDFSAIQIMGLVKSEFNLQNTACLFMLSSPRCL